MEPYETQAKQLYLSNELKSHQVLAQLKSKNVKLLKEGDMSAELPSLPADAEDETRPPKKQRLETSSAAAVRFQRTLQAQCITGRSKPRVLFCEDISAGDIKVVKGPLAMDKADEYVASEWFKEILNLSRPNATVILLDNGINQDHPAPGYYLISTLLGISEEEFSFDKFELRTTSLETGVSISKNEINHWEHADLGECDRATKLKILLCLAFRKCIGTNDTCCRNIIKDKSEIISIDDPALFRATPHMWKTPMNATVRSAYLLAVSELWAELTQELGRWCEVVRSFMASGSAATCPLITDTNLNYFVDQAAHFAANERNWTF